MENHFTHRNLSFPGYTEEDALGDSQMEPSVVCSDKPPRRKELRSYYIAASQKLRGAGQDHPPLVNHLNEELLKSDQVAPKAYQFPRAGFTSIKQIIIKLRSRHLLTEHEKWRAVWSTCRGARPTLRLAGALQSPTTSRRQPWGTICLSPSLLPQAQPAAPGAPRP